MPEGLTPDAPFGGPREGARSLSVKRGPRRPLHRPPRVSVLRCSAGAHMTLLLLSGPRLPTARMVILAAAACRRPIRRGASGHWACASPSTARTSSRVRTTGSRSGRRACTRPLSQGTSSSNTAHMNRGRSAPGSVWKRPSPISDWWRLSWKRMYRRAHATYASSVRRL